MILDIIKFILGIRIASITSYIALFILPWNGCLIPSDFESSIQRTALNPSEAALIAQAESLCPSDFIIDTYCSPSVEIPNQACHWYCRNGGVVPIGITSEAIAYYAAELERRRAESSDDSGRVSVSFEYSAHVDHLPTWRDYIDVSVVVMELHWRETCGSLCGYYMTANRSVYFDSAGNVLDVDGDGDASIAVS